MAVEKPKQLLRPITTGANSAMMQSQFVAIIWNLLKAREKSRVHGAIGFGFASHWLKNWRESFKPITKRSNRNRVITFDTHLKTALSKQIAVFCIIARKPWQPFSRPKFLIFFNYALMPNNNLKQAAHQNNISSSRHF